MKTVTLALLCLFLIPFGSYGQSQASDGFNLDFEQSLNGRPKGWTSSQGAGYRATLDSETVYHGKYALCIQSGNEKGAFESIAFRLPHNYDGKKITLSGYIKTEAVAGGFAGLWIRIDPRISFDNMHDQHVTGTTDWKKYSITLDMLPTKTEQIILGALLTGSGKMWVDQLTLSIDGKPVQTIQPLKPLPAEADTAFDKGSGISRIPTDPATLENLKILGLVWGFVKYYHPNIAKGDYNWDYALFRVLPKILKAETPSARDQVLVDWIKALGGFPLQSKATREDKKQAKMTPDLDWLKGPEISDTLSELLLQIKNAERTKENYYVGTNPMAGNPVFKHERPYRSMQLPDCGFRLLALYRYWNIIQYFYPDKYLIKEDWKNVLETFLPAFLTAETDTAYTLTALRLIARIHDTHANIWGSNALLTAYFGNRYSAASVTFVGDIAIINGFYDSQLGRASGLKKGDILTHINGQLIDSIIQKQLPITPASNYTTQLRDLARRLLRTNAPQIAVTYLRGGIPHKTVLKTYPADSLQLNGLGIPDSCFKMIRPDIAYLYLGSIRNKYLPDLFKKIQPTKGLIIDLRCYPSEFVVYSLGRYLMPKKTPFVKFSSCSITQPGLFTTFGPLTVGQKNKHYYRGKIILLVNEKTLSQAEFTAMAFRAAPHTTVIGSTTAGADGNVSPFYLPGGIQTMISGLGVYYPDGTETQRVGIVPDIVVKPTLTGIKNGSDEVLEKAIALINK